MSLVLHILRKDWKLLWPLGGACAVLQAVLAFLEYRPESFAASDGGNAAAMILSLSLGIGLVLTILLVVQQDALPGVNQDWLVRPIKRRDLLVAKVLFVLLVIQVPIFAVHWVRGVAEGLGAGDMLGAALLSNLELALLFSLPVLTLAVLSKSVTEALVTALAALMFVLLAHLVVATLAMIASHSFHLGGVTDDTGLEWIVGLMHHAVLLVTAIAVVGLQYHRRDTRTARIVFALGLLLFVIVGRLSWGPAFALQESLSAEPESGRAVTLSLSNAAAPPMSGFALDPADVKARQKPAQSGSQRLLLGIEVGGLTPDAVLHADRVTVRLIDSAGRTLYRGTAQDWDLRGLSRSSAGQRQVIDVPKHVYARSAGQAIRIELDYSLTLLKPRVLPALAAVDGNELLEGIGRCASRLADDGTGFEVGCDAAGELPACLSVSLRAADPAQVGPETFVCDLDYAPDAWRFSVEPIERFVRKLALPGGASGPVAGGASVDLKAAAIVFRRYDAVTHFSRRVTVADVHVADLAAEPSRP
jgi:hypothetical protein